MTHLTLHIIMFTNVDVGILICDLMHYVKPLNCLLCLVISALFIQPEAIIDKSPLGLDILYNFSNGIMHLFNFLTFNLIYVICIPHFYLVQNNAI